MKFMQTEKKQLLIYVIIAYGITYVMGLLMWYGYGKGLDLSAFPNAQMLYPAAGVMMAYLITKKGDKNLPTAFFIFFVALTAVLVVCTAASVLAPQNRDLMSMPYSQWATIMEYVIIGGSVIFWILLLQSGKEKRRSYGLNSEHWNISIRMILLFIGLYLLRFVIACALSGQLSEFGKIMANPTTWIIFFYCFGKLFPVSSGILWRRIRMEILSSASSSEKIWTKRRRNPFGLCVGCMASANRLLLLHYAGYGADGSGKPVCYLYFTGDFYGIYLYENPEYLGSDNYSFSE